jgi:phosphate transport system permease protein
MSDAQVLTPAGTIDWNSDKARRRVRRRYAADRRLQAYGIIAIALAVGLLGVLVASLVRTGFPAFLQTKVDLPIYVDASKVDAEDPASGNYRGLIKAALNKAIPDVPKDQQRSVRKILTSHAAYILRDYVVDHPDSIGKTITLPIALSDPFDQLYKGVIPKHMDALNWVQEEWFERLQNRNVVVEHDGRTSLKLDVYVDPAAVEDGDYVDLARNSLQAYFPRVRDSSLFEMLAPDAPAAIAKAVAEDPAIVGKTVQIYFPVSEHTPRWLQAKSRRFSIRVSTKLSSPRTMFLSTKGCCARHSTGSSSSTRTAASRSARVSPGRSPVRFTRSSSVSC